MQTVLADAEVQGGRLHRVAHPAHVGAREVLAHHVRPVAVRAAQVALVGEPDADRERHSRSLPPLDSDRKVRRSEIMPPMATPMSQGCSIFTPWASDVSAAASVRSGESRNRLGVARVVDGADATMHAQMSDRETRSFGSGAEVPAAGQSGWLRATAPVWPLGLARLVYGLLWWQQSGWKVPSDGFGRKSGGGLWY